MLTSSSSVTTVGEMRQDVEGTRKHAANADGRCEPHLAARTESGAMMMTTTTTTTVTAPVQRKHDQFSQWAQVVCGGGGGGDDGRRVCAPETGILSRAAAQAQYIIKVRRRGSCAKSVRMCDRMRPCSERSRFGWWWCASGAMVMMTR